MGIFRRKSKAAEEASTADDAAPDEAVPEDDRTAEFDEDESQDADDRAVAEDDDETGADERLPRPHPVDRSDGPFDRSEVDGIEDHLNFGSIAIVAIEGMELRLDMDDTSQQVTGLTAVVGQSACQLQAFAAPKSRGIWDGIRDDIADGLIASGGTAKEELGPLGIELHVRMPGRGADGRTTYSPARFIGVDGPRWFLRAVLSGSAATDEQQAEPFLEYLRRTVVLRGGEARAPRELLPLNVPDELLARPEEAPVSEDGASPSAEDFKPFERGPEITEVR